MAANPNTTRISNEIWELWQRFDALESSAQLGGVYAAKAGYHNYRSALKSTDYSTGRDVANDKLGPGEKASAIDLTMSAAAMVRYTKRLDDAARARDPRLYINGEPVLREFIGTKDNKTVYCWVFVGGRALGVGADSGPDPGRDTSHLWHLHLSFIRKYCNSAAAVNQILAILRGDAKPAPPAPKPSTPSKPTGGDVPDAKDLLNSDVVPNRWWRDDAQSNPSVRWEFAVTNTWDEAHNASVKADEANAKADRIVALLQALTGRDFTDEAAIVAGVLQGLTPAAIATAVASALPKEMAQQVVTELGQKIASS